MSGEIIVWKKKVSKAYSEKFQHTKVAIFFLVLLSFSDNQYFKASEVVMLRNKSKWSTWRGMEGDEAERDLRATLAPPTLGTPALCVRVV